MERTVVSRIVENYGIEDSALAKFLSKCSNGELEAIDVVDFRMAARIARYENLMSYVLGARDLYYGPNADLVLHAKIMQGDEKKYYEFKANQEGLDHLISHLSDRLTEGMYWDSKTQITLYQAVNLSEDQSLKEAMKDELWYRIEQLKETLVKEYDCDVDDILNLNLFSQETENKEGSEVIEYYEHVYDMFRVTFKAKVHELSPYEASYGANICYNKEGLRNLEGVMARVKEFFLQTRQQKVAAQIILDFGRGVNIRIHEYQHRVLQLDYDTYDSTNMRYSETFELTAEGVHLALMDYLSRGLTNERRYQRDVYRLVPAARLAGDYRLKVLAQYGLIRIIDSDGWVVETFGLCESGIITLADHLMQLAGQAEKTVSPS